MYLAPVWIELYVDELSHHYIHLACDMSYKYQCWVTWPSAEQHIVSFIQSRVLPPIPYSFPPSNTVSSVIKIDEYNNL